MLTFITSNAQKDVLFLKTKFFAPNSQMGCAVNGFSLLHLKPHHSFLKYENKKKGHEPLN